MVERKPLSIRGISTLLEALNLSKYQRHDSFHILKFEDHLNEIPRQAFLRSENYFEITFSINHEIDISVDNKEASSTGNNLFFLSPGQSINVDVKELKHGSIGYMLLFTSDFLNFSATDFSVIQQFPYFNMHLSPVYFMDLKDIAVFQQYMERIYVEFQNLEKNNIEIIRSFLTILLFEANRLLTEDNLKSIINSRAEEITYRFEIILKGTIHKKKKLAYYSSQLNISDVYLSECIKKVTGQTAKKIITNYLIFEAKSLITQSTKTIDNVAYQLGFNDTPNFINFFKKNTNMTPNQFRNNKMKMGNKNI